MQLFHRLTADTCAALGPPEISHPAPERCLSGTPIFTTWNIEDRNGLYAGRWQATPGKWQVIYDEWEYCHILQGHSVLCAEDGTAHTLRAGDSFLIRPGFRGTWEVLETTLKDYVILTTP